MNSGQLIREYREYREKEKMTQESLAAYLGIHPSELEKYENGSWEDLKVSTLRTLCEILKIPPHYFVFPDYFKKETTPSSHPDVLNGIKELYGDEVLDLITVFYSLESTSYKAKVIDYVKDLVSLEYYHYQYHKKHRRQAHTEKVKL